MQQETAISRTHSIESGGEYEAKSSPSGRFRRISALLVFAILIAVGQLALPAERLVVPAGAVMVTADLASNADFGGSRWSRAVPAMHSANLLQDLIDILQDIIDILDGKPRTPVQPATTEEEREEINDAADAADEEGVDVPEERVEEDWMIEEVYDFIYLVIFLIEEHLANQ